MSRKRPPSNFLILDEDVVPKVDPASGELIPTPEPLNPHHAAPTPGPEWPMADVPPPEDPPSVTVADVIPAQRHPSEVHYEARITIVDAWQYPGFLKEAPEWVDRNWAAYGDYDPIREIEPGPALRVPTAPGTFVFCRVGDYIARQEVKITRELSDIRVEVWNRDQFEKLFFPVAAPATIEGTTNPQNAEAEYADAG